MNFHVLSWHLTQLYRDWGKEELYKKYLNTLSEELRKSLLQ